MDRKASRQIVHAGQLESTRPFAQPSERPQGRTLGEQPDAGDTRSTDAEDGQGCRLGDQKA